MHNLKSQTKHNPQITNHNKIKNTKPKMCQTKKKQKKQNKKQNKNKRGHIEHSDHSVWISAVIDESIKPTNNQINNIHCIAVQI